MTTTTDTYECYKCTPRNIAAHLAEVAALFDHGAPHIDEDARANPLFATFEIYAGLVINRDYAAHSVSPRFAPDGCMGIEYDTLEAVGLIDIFKDKDGDITGYCLNWFESDATSLEEMNLAIDRIDPNPTIN